MIATLGFTKSAARHMFDNVLARYADVPEQAPQEKQEAMMRGLCLR